MPSDELDRMIRARCEVTHLAIEVGPPVRLVLQVASPEVTGSVTLTGVEDLAIRPSWSTWSLDALEFTDVSTHQLDGVSVMVGAGQDGFMTCQCASVDVEVTE